MTCDSAAPLLAASADGLLDEGRRGILEAHLAGCAACRSALADQIAVRAWLARTPEAPVPAGFRDGVNARINDSEGLLGVADFRAWTIRLAPLAALLALAGWLGFGTAPSAQASVPAGAAAASVSFAPSRASDWQRSVSGDALLEAALRPSVSGEPDVR